MTLAYLLRILHAAILRANTNVYKQCNPRAFSRHARETFDVYGLARPMGGCGTSYRHCDSTCVPLSNQTDPTWSSFCSVSAFVSDVLSNISLETSRSNSPRESYFQLFTLSTRGHSINRATLSEGEKSERWSRWFRFAKYDVSEFLWFSGNLFSFSTSRQNNSVVQYFSIYFIRFPRSF